MQWSQEEIRFCYQETWQKESQEYEVQEAKKRRQFQDVMLWQQSMFEQIFEQEGVEEKIRLFFSTNSRQVKEKLQQQQVKKPYNKKTQQRMKQFRGYIIWKQRKIK